ncbi:MAG: twin-arginine translocation signal domain-containing protein [Patescibacteria group bacterium]
MGLRESGPRKKEELGDVVSRRAFLKGGLGVGAVAAMPGVVYALTESQALREKEDDAYLALISKDPTAQRLFQEAPTQKQVGSVIRSLARTNELWIKDFERRGGLMHDGARILLDAKRHFRGNGTVLKVAADDRTGGKNKYFLVTAAHVARNVPLSGGKSWTYHPGDIDVALYEMSEGEAMNPRTQRVSALSLLPLAKQGEDISGQVGMVLASDNDAGPFERKQYPSRISPRLSDEVLRRMNVRVREDVQYMKKSNRESWRLIILPPGEAKPQSNGRLPTEGASGGAFLHVPPGSQEVAFGGLYVAGRETAAEGVTYSIGVVVDHMYVRETLEAYFRNSQ